MLKGFLSFDRFMFPRIARIIYFIGLIIIALTALAGIAAGVLVAISDPIVGTGAIVGAIIGALIGALVWRLMVELWLVLFSINDHLKAIRNRGEL